VNTKEGDGDSPEQLPVFNSNPGNNREIFILLLKLPVQIKLKHYIKTVYAF
jgi:hypothetical protein